MSGWMSEWLKEGVGRGEMGPGEVTEGEEGSPKTERGTLASEVDDWGLLRTSPSASSTTNPDRLSRSKTSALVSPDPLLCAASCFLMIFRSSRSTLCPYPSLSPS